MTSSMIFVLTNTILPYTESIEGASALFYFTIYSFCGWLLENIYHFIVKGSFFKEGFFIGPFKPMYGFAPVFLLYTVEGNIPWAGKLLLCFLIPSVIEYISGFLLYKLFRKRWWDYSHTAFQLHGHVCLAFSLCWLILSLLCIQYIHPLVDSLYVAVEGSWAWLSPFVLLYFIGEMILAYRRHSVKRLSAVKETNPLQ